HPVLLEDLEALLLPGTRDTEDRDLLGWVVAELEAGLDDATRDDVDARVRDDAHHHGDLVDAGLREDQLGEARGLRDGRVSPDLAIVRGLPTVLSNCVEERQRAAARSDHESEVSVELGDIAGDAAVVHRVHLFASKLE